MFLRDSIDILVPQHTKDSIGRDIVKYPVNRTINADFQPLKYNVYDKPFGITDKTSNLIFCKDFNITADMRIGFNGKQYLIDSILKYRNHVEIYVEAVV